MSEFNKVEYWKNRKAGKRGQGPKFNRVGKSYSPLEWAKIKAQEKQYANKATA